MWTVLSIILAGFMFFMADAAGREKDYTWAAIFAIVGLFNIVMAVIQL
jgi:hypothetical protein